MMAAPEKMQALGELRRDEPMSRHTSWRAGGKAELFFIPASVEDLQAFLRELDAETCRLSCANSTRRRQYSGWASAATCS
jgi:hypothetical protein